MTGVSKNVRFCRYHQEVFVFFHFFLHLFTQVAGEKEGEKEPAFPSGEHLQNIHGGLDAESQGPKLRARNLIQVFLFVMRTQPTKPSICLS